MAKRKLEELNLLDDFLFGTMVSHPKVGEDFVHAVLKIIFGRNFDRLTVVPQKTYYGNDTDLHGARLDVYLEETLSDEEVFSAATVYDMEPDKNSDANNRESLPRRTRFYHAVIDAECLKSGDNYQHLKNVIVIMITTYDPFGENQMVKNVKQDKEVSLVYMKIFEREEMLIEQGRKEGRQNTELERLKAEITRLKAAQHKLS